MLAALAAPEHSALTGQLFAVVAAGWKPEVALGLVKAFVMRLAGQRYFAALPVGRLFCLLES